MSKMENMYTKWKTTAIAKNRNRGNAAMVLVCAARRRVGCGSVGDNAKGQPRQQGRSGQLRRKDWACCARHGAAFERAGAMVAETRTVRKKRKKKRRQDAIFAMDAMDAMDAMGMDQQEQGHELSSNREPRAWTRVQALPCVLEGGRRAGRQPLPLRSVFG